MKVLYIFTVQGKGATHLNTDSQSLVMYASSSNFTTGKLMHTKSTEKFFSILWVVHQFI